MRLLIESDVLIDHIVRHKRHGLGMQRLLVMASFGDAELWASAHALCDAQCVVSDMVGPSEARRCLRALLEVLRVCDTNAAQVIDVLHMAAGDFEACLAEQVAQAIGAEAIVTRDRVRYGRISLPVRSPEEVETHMRAVFGVRYEELVIGAAPPA